jgi:hypothetical protein
MNKTEKILEVFQVLDTHLDSPDADHEALHNLFWEANRLRNPKLTMIEFEAVYESIHRKIFDILHIVL